MPTPWARARFGRRHLPRFRLRPAFLGAMLMLLMTLLGTDGAQAQNQSDLVSLTLPTSDYERVRQALREAVEEQGLIFTPPNAFGEMLERTGKDLDQGESPYGQAEIFQFCSAVLSWQLVKEDPAQIGRCPLSIALYTLRQASGTVHLVYRSPGEGSPGLHQAGALLQRIVTRTASQW